eukprot:gene5260-biopygen1671
MVLASGIELESKLPIRKTRQPHDPLPTMCLTQIMDRIGNYKGYSKRGIGMMLVKQTRNRYDVRDRHDFRKTNVQDRHDVRKTNGGGCVWLHPAFGSK